MNFAPEQLLWPVAWLYWLAVTVRTKLYDWNILPVHHLPQTVISVGNIAVGGTGKTPITIALCKYLLDQGLRPGILTRGYGSGLGPRDSILLRNGLVIASDRHFSRVADEAMLQSKKLPTVPIVVGAGRYRNGKWALELGVSVDVWVMDDGFQHRSLARKHDLLLLDASLKEESGHLLPVGRLREPVKNAYRATGFLLTRADRTEVISSAQVPLLDEALHRSKDCLKVKFTAGDLYNIDGGNQSLVDTGPLLLVCGIAKPKLLLEQLREKGLNIFGAYTIKDHGRFKDKSIRREAKQVSGIVTTEKDFYRDPGVFRSLNLPVWLVPLNVDIKSEDWQHLGLRRPVL